MYDSGFVYYFGRSGLWHEWLGWHWRWGNKVPILVMLFGFSQKMAQGTTLALIVAPIGVLAAYAYYKQGNVNLYSVGFIIIGFVFGSLLRAKYVSHLSNPTVVRIFGIFLLLLAIKIIIIPEA